jgi:hypothetical protein
VQAGEGIDWGAVIATAGGIAAAFGVPGAAVVAGVARKRGRREGEEIERIRHQPPPKYDEGQQ